MVDGRDLGVVKGEPIDLALLGGENIDDVALLAVAELDPDCVGQHQVRNALGRFDRDLRRDPSTERHAREDHVAQVERVHDIEVEIGKIVDRGHGARQLAASEARMGRRDHRKRSGKLLDHAVGRFDPDRGMQQQQGPSGPALDELDANSCYVGQCVCSFDAVEHGRDHLGRAQCGLISAALTSSLFCLIWARKKASNSDEVISKGCPPNAVSLSCTLLICSAFAVSRYSFS